MAQLRGAIHFLRVQSRQYQVGYIAVVIMIFFPRRIHHYTQQWLENFISWNDSFPYPRVMADCRAIRCMALSAAMKPQVKCDESPDTAILMSEMKPCNCVLNKEYIPLWWSPGRTLFLPAADRFIKKTFLQSHFHDKIITILMNHLMVLKYIFSGHDYNFHFVNISTPQILLSISCINIIPLCVNEDMFHKLNLFFYLHSKRVLLISGILNLIGSICECQ